MFKSLRIYKLFKLVHSYQLYYTLLDTKALWLVFNSSTNNLLNYSLILSSSSLKIIYKSQHFFILNFELE